MAEPLTSGICTEFFGLVECSGDVYMTLHVHMDSWQESQRSLEVLASNRCRDNSVDRARW